MHDSDLNEKYRSTYKPFYSIETVLVCVASDIHCCVDEKKAAFDSVDHNKQLRIQDISLPWFQLYLSNRSQAVQVDEEKYA